MATKTFSMKMKGIRDLFPDNLHFPLPDSEQAWDFSSGADRVVHEILLSDSPQATEKDGFVVKDVLRTGEWDGIPTDRGMLNRKLKIVRDGHSDADAGVISLSELVENFKSGVLKRVQIPLSDEERDHKNATRVNTGFVNDLWIEDRDGGSYLVAAMNITEPDVKEKVLRGTYADVSCGIPWRVKVRGKNYNALLEHVCITNRPYIDGLGPFFAASDKPENIQVANYVLKPDGEAEVPEKTDGEGISGLRTRTAKAKFSLEASLGKEDEEKDETPAKPAVPRGSVSELEAARRLREIRLSQPVNHTTKEGHVSTLTREELERLELSEEQRAAIQTVLDERASLASRVREQEADSRIEELKELGLSERPGALKFYREVYLADDERPAVVLLSEGGQKSSLNAREVLDKFIDGIKNNDGKVVLSDQALVSGDDTKPPATADGEQTKPLEERVAEAKRSLGRQ